MPKVSFRNGGTRTRYDTEDPTEAEHRQCRQHGSERLLPTEDGQSPVPSESVLRPCRLGTDTHKSLSNLELTTYLTMTKRRQTRAATRLLLGLPLLFAVPSSTFHARPLRSSTPHRPQHRHALRAAATESPSLKEVIDLSRDSYRLLDEACYTAQITPTISFKYTRPAAERDGGDVLVGGDDASESGGSAADGLRRVLATLDASAERNELGGDSRRDKPVLLHLPGLDGVGISAIRQFDDLSNAFEFWRLSVDPRHDRTSFADLVSIVSRFVQEVSVDRDRRVVLSGESFGGLLAPAVAMAVEAKARREGRDNSMIGMVLVNPATSFYKTNWSTWAPILASLRHIEREEEEGVASSLPTPYSVIGGMALSMTVPDSNQFKSIFDIVTRTRVTTAQELQDVVTSMADGFGILADRLPAEVIEHRVTNWLNVGSEVVNSRLEKLQVPTLVIGGDEDSMLPTKEECDRLVQIMPNCTAMSVKDSGHFILDDRLNLTQAIIEAPFDPFGLRRAEKNYNPITDWKAPTDEVIREAIDNRVKSLRDVLSPKFFSTSADGRRSVGLGQVPNPEGPMLFVANHQLLGLDLGLIIAELLEKRRIAARGLAHPVVFAGGNGFGGGAGPTGPSERITKRNKDGPVDRRPGDFETFGVSSRSLHRRSAKLWIRSVYANEPCFST